MNKSIDIQSYARKVKNKFYYRIFLYYLFLIIFCSGLFSISRFYFNYHLSVFVFVFFIVLIITAVELVKFFKIKQVLDIARKLIARGLYSYAYYLLLYLEDYYRYKDISDMRERIKDLANISEQLDNYEDMRQLYDLELDRIISLVDFNIDVYENLYIQNKLTLKKSQDVIRDFAEKDTTLKKILDEQINILSLEEYRLQAFYYIKEYFEDLKKQQIKLALTLPDIDILDKNYGRFINQLLDRAFYTVEAENFFDRVDRAKTKFYNIFSEILKAQKKEEIKERLKELQSI